LSKLPVVSGAEAVAALERAGFIHLRTKGSHAMLVRVAPPRILISVPLHKELDRGMLRGIIRQSGLGVEQFLAFLNG
jgi:predicted RNA binding protein YcfA (HicA-like mRNA interferase family)